jgi:hypothetical protein
MMIHDRSSQIPMEHAAVDAHPTPAERTDDACSRIHRYQQQLRAELLAAATDVAGRPAARWQWLCTSPMRAIERRVRGLIHASASYADRQSTSLGPALAEA